MTKRIFRSIVFAALTVLLAAILLIMGVMHSYFAQIQLEQLQEETALAAHAVANEGMAYFDRLTDAMDCRITWIAGDGAVLFDNRGDSREMENHLQRQEVRDALETGYGQSSRYSATLMEEYLYVARRLPDGTVLRLSGTRSTVPHLMVEILWPVLVIVGAAVLLSLWLANRLSQSIVRPLNGLNLNQPLAHQGYGELQPLLLRLDSQQEQLRRQSRELERRQQEFYTVTHSLAEGLVLLSSSGTILSINPAAAALLEVTPNCAGADFAVANRNQQIKLLVDRAFAGQKGEQLLELRGGIWLASVSPVLSGNRPSGVVLLLMDVTQQQQAEALRREFSANVSHELKTPLHAISGYTELLKSGLVRQEDQPGFYEKIYAEAQRLIHLVEDILRLSRLDEGAEDMAWCQADLYDQARQTVQELSAAAELAQVAVTLQGEPVVLRSIPQLLSAIVFNLLDNAIKYNRPGGSVRICVAETETEVCLRVADTGIGIPEEHRERVFERFYRVDKSHSKEVGGTGLGLSIVKHAVLILKGRLELESLPGTGTTVTVRFPKER